MRVDGPKRPAPPLQPIRLGTQGKHRGNLYIHTFRPETAIGWFEPAPDRLGSAPDKPDPAPRRPEPTFETYPCPKVAEVNP